MSIYKLLRVLVNTIMKVNKALIQFHQKICPDLPIDSFEVFCRLVAALNEMNECCDDK